MKIEISQIASFIADLENVKNLDKLLRSLTAIDLDFSVKERELIVPVPSENPEHLNVINSGFHLHCNKFQIVVLTD